MGDLLLAGASSSSYEPPSLAGEQPANDAATTLSNPLSSSSPSPSPGYRPTLAPSAQQALAAEVDTDAASVNRYDISDGAASVEDQAVAAQMFRRRERKQEYAAESKAVKMKLAKGCAACCCLLAVTMAVFAGKVLWDHRAPDPSRTRPSRGGENASWAALPPEPAPEPASSDDSDEEPWDFVGGLTVADGVAHYVPDPAQDIPVVWPGARSATTTWRDTASGSTFMFGGIGCAGEEDGRCGDQTFALGPENVRSVIGSTPDYLNDMWKWQRGGGWAVVGDVGGSRQAGGASDGGYTEPDSGAPGWPGKRAHGAAWATPLGAAIFGGQTCTNCDDQQGRSIAVMNDLWLAYEPYTDWSWIPGPYDAPAVREGVPVVGLAGTGVYGADGEASTWPGARAGMAVWRDADDSEQRAYMFGGRGYGSSSYASGSDPGHMGKSLAPGPRRNASALTAFALQHT